MASDPPAFAAGGRGRAAVKATKEGRSVRSRRLWHFRRIMGARDFNDGTVGSFREAESHEASATARSWRRATTAAWMQGAQGRNEKAWARGVVKESGRASCGERWWRDV